jgi:hypothetical protein
MPIANATRGTSLAEMTYSKIKFDDYSSGTPNVNADNELLKNQPFFSRIGRRGF